MLSLIKTIFKILILISCLFVWSETSAIDAMSPSVGKGVIASSSLNVRFGPGRTQRVIQVLHRGNEVQVLSYHDGWVKISYKEKVGYIRNRKKYIRIVHSPVVPLKTKNRIRKAKAESKDINFEIQKHQAQVQDFSEDETSIINGLDDLDLALNRNSAKVRKIRSDLSRLEEKTKLITSKSLKLMKQITVTEEYIAKRLSALYKLNLIGPMHILASADSAYDLIYRKFAMERILEYDDEVLTRHKENKVKLAGILKELDNKKVEKVFLEAGLRKQSQIMSKKRVKKKRLLEDIQNKKSLELAAIDSLKQAAQALDQTILSLHVEPKIKPGKPVNQFDEFKGLLNMPVKGKIVSFFGPYKKGKYKVVNFRSGIEIKADRGEPIQAVHSGVVLYSGWFKSYGNMIIVDHGEHYYTLYAHAEELFKSKGDYVEVEEVIATVGDTASMTGSNLYFEVRHRGEPMNPLNWLRDS
jgi:septal ring factor EnvC (AmiA/AmiB activator)